jgi:hypothetical protein
MRLVAEQVGDGERGEQVRAIPRFVAAGVLGLTLSSTDGVMPLPQAAAEGICPTGHAESGIRGNWMACVNVKTGKVIWVEV